MVKKLQKMADKKKAAAATPFPAGLLDSDMAKNVKDSAQQIWAAGLASFAKAQGEGSKVFEALVSEGLKLQKKTQSAAEEKLSAVASKVTGMAGDVGSKAGQHWDKLESIFEARVAKALKSLGVPSAGDVQSLIKRIDDLAVSAGLKKATPAKAAKKGGRPWEAGKAFDGSAPIGPIVPAKDVAHADKGAITLSVNGKEHQRGDLSDLIWSVPETIAYLSRLFELRPGDLIYTGTPEGVGPVVVGDLMVGKIDGVGELHVKVI